MGKKYSNVKPNQAKALEDLEQLIGKEIKYNKKDIEWDKSPTYTTEEDSVKELNLNSRDLKELPESIGELEDLKSLLLHANQLNSLPNSIGKLKSLQLIALGENNLKELPDSFGNLVALKESWLNDNKLTELPKTIGNLKFLEELNCEHNRLKEIPDSIGNLKSLITLDLSHNQLTALPETIGNLKSLETLDLEHNKLTWLPEALNKLKTLEKLDVSDNKLSMLPGFLDSLRNLKTLDIRRNQLVTLPGFLWRLQNLYELRITGNPLIDEWKKVRNKGIDAILDYCREIGSCNVFVSYSISDYESGKYPIDEIANSLQEKEDISNVYHCKKDMKSDGKIDKFMNETIPHCQFVIFMATRRSVKSEACLHELAVTNTHNIKIIPILCDDVTWEDPVIQKSGLSHEFGVLLKDYEVPKLADELYDNIMKYKRKHNVFTREEAELEVEVLNIKRTITNYVTSEEFGKVVKRNMDLFRGLFQDLSQRKISPQKYFLECAEIISPSKKSPKKPSKEPSKKAPEKPPKEEQTAPEESSIKEPKKPKEETKKDKKKEKEPKKPKEDTKKDKKKEKEPKKPKEDTKKDKKKEKESKKK